MEEAPVDPAHPQGFRVVVDLTSHVPTLEVLDAIGAWNVPVSIHWWPQEEIALVDRLLRIPQLQSLELEISNAAVVGPLADAFAKMPHVPVVDAHIDETGDPQFAQHREAVAAALARIPKLKSLRWDGPGEAPLSAFRGHQELSSLGCFAPRVTDAVTADLRAIPRLERLNLQTTEEITEEQVGQLLKDGPPVKYLDLRVETLKAQANLKAKFPAVEFSFQSQ